MPLRCIFVPTGPGIQPERRLDVAFRLARHTHAHIDTLFVNTGRDARSPSPNLVIATSSLPHCNAACEMKALAGVARGAFQRWCTGANVPQQSYHRLDATFASRREQRGELETIMALAGWVNDLIVIDNPTHRGPFEAAAFDAAVFSSGRPTLIVSEQLPDDLLHHVVIAWNGSLKGRGLSDNPSHCCTKRSAFRSSPYIPSASAKPELPIRDTICIGTVSWWSTRQW
jgi:hypothetical protein